MKLHVGSHYGSMIWDLGSEHADQYFNAWSTCVKLTWKMPRSTDFVEHLLGSGLSSVRVDTLSRYAKFVRGLVASPSKDVSVMSGVAKLDVRSVTGWNIALLRKETGLVDVIAVSGYRLREVLQCRALAVPDMDRWRIVYLGKFLTANLANYVEVGELTKLIDSLCVS